MMNDIKYAFLKIAFMLLVLIALISCTNNTKDKRFYTISYISEYGVCPETISLEENTILTNAHLPILKNTEEYSFVGWFSDDKKIEIGTRINNDMVLRAKWKSTIFHISFDTQGGTKIDDQIIKEYGKVIKPEEPSKTGYFFIGWYTDSNCQNLYDFNLNVTSSFTLFARWVTTVYTVTFVTNCSIEMDEIIIAEKDILPTIEIPNNIGYVFSGWYLDSDFTTEYNLEASVTKDLVLYAKWIMTKKEVSIDMESIYQTFEYFDTKYEPYTVIITDENPDLSVIKRVLNTYRVLINLDLSNCTKLKNLTVDGNSVFDGNGYLRSIKLPDSVLTIPKSAFSKCSNLYSAYFNKVKRIENYAFYACPNLHICNLPNTVTYIGSGSFQECDRITSITIPNNVTHLGDSAFSLCRNLSEVVVLSSNITLGDGVFSSTEIKSFKVPKETKTIGGSLFSYCGNLREIYLPESLTTIKRYAFEQCGRLTKIYYQGTKYQWADISIEIDNDSLFNATIIYNTDY